MPGDCDNLKILIFTAYNYSENQAVGFTILHICFLFRTHSCFHILHNRSNPGETVQEELWFSHWFLGIVLTNQHSVRNLWDYFLFLSYHQCPSPFIWSPILTFLCWYSYTQYWCPISSNKQGDQKDSVVKGDLNPHTYPYASLSAMGLFRPLLAIH